MSKHKEHALDQMRNIADAIAKAVVTHLPPSPARPLKGRGRARCEFPFSARQKSCVLRAAFFDALPPAHKAEVARLSNKGLYFRWTKHISPEAYQLWRDTIFVLWNMLIHITVVSERR